MPPSACRILLVEDDRDQAQLFAQVLSMVGYTVVIAANAEEGIAQLAASPFNLLLADWDLPGMQGNTLISFTKMHYPGMKTILYSNYTEVDRIAATCDTDAWFRKMDGIDHLRQLIADTLCDPD